MHERVGIEWWCASLLALSVLAPCAANVRAPRDQDAGPLDLEFRSLFGRQSIRGASVHSLALDFTVANDHDRRMEVV